MAPKKENKKQNDIDFEIQFIEGVLKEKPDFIEALVALGDLYTKRGFFEKGLEIDKQLARLRPSDPTILYNLSCSYSLVNNVDKSLEAMKLAIGYGYSDYGYLENDSDLDNLRQDSRFQQFFVTIKNVTPRKS